MLIQSVVPVGTIGRMLASIKVPGWALLHLTTKLVPSCLCVPLWKEPLGLRTGRGRDFGSWGLCCGQSVEPGTDLYLGTHRTTSTWSKAHWSCPAPSCRGCHHRSITPLTLASLGKSWEHNESNDLLIWFFCNVATVFTSFRLITCFTSQWYSILK